MEPLAKPTGETLADHTRHVRDEMALVLAARPFLTYKYAIRAGQNLPILADACARWHDAGKQHRRWQDACRADYAAYLKTGRVGNELRKGTVRHEFASLVRMRADPASTWLPPVAYAAVAAHHSKLGHRKQYVARWNDDTTFKLFKQELWRLSGSIMPDDAAEEDFYVRFERAIAWRYQYSGLRALLRLADHRASAREAHEHEQLRHPNEETGKLVVPTLGSFRYDFPWGNELRGVQKLVPNFWDERFTLLRAPTGAGKTDAALLWARRQITLGRADRLVWAMPTRFTANALFLATTNQLSRTGIYHSSAWHLAQQREQNAADNGPRAAWRQELDYARLLETPATITTLDQLCLALTATREDHHTTFWNLAHSCVVIDEADFYDDFTQRNLVVLLRALRVLHVPVLLMSATLPESARDLYALAGEPAGKIWEDPDPTEAQRPRLHLHRAGPAETPADLAPLLERGLRGEPLIIYANTVGRAQAYWDWFGQQQAAVPVVLYHSRFTEPDKERIEQKLLAMLGPKAWATGAPTGVAILTQIGELSVNISADLMIADLCPTDRLAQRAGRLSRFQQRHDKRQNVLGELHLVEPEKTDKSGQKQPYPAPYGHYQKGTGWEMSTVLEHANRQLTEGTYSAQQFVNLVNELYPEVEEEAAHVKANRKALENAAVNNWLLLPDAETALEDDDTDQWKSRDIGPQKVVYANTNFSPIPDEGDPRDFPNSFAFREWALPRAISVPFYDFTRARKAGKLTEEKLLVNQETEPIWIVQSRYYDALQGLRFDKEPSAEDE